MIEYSFRIGLFGLLLGGVIALMSLLPAQLPSDAVASLEFFIASAAIFSYWLPMQTLGTILIASMSFWGLLAFWDISTWLLRQITR